MLRDGFHIITAENMVGSDKTSALGCQQPTR
jgi:hypothetical protein